MLRRLIRLRRYSAKRISAEKRRNSGGPKTSVPKFGMGWSPPVPYDPLRSPWSHATCYMWYRAWANQGQSMGHGYGIRVIVVHCDRHHESLARRPRQLGCFKIGLLRGYGPYAWSGQIADTALSTKEPVVDSY